MDQKHRAVRGPARPPAATGAATAAASGSGSGSKPNPYAKAQPGTAATTKPSASAALASASSSTAAAGTAVAEKAAADAITAAAKAAAGFSITPKSNLSGAVRSGAAGSSAASRVLRYRGARQFRTRVVCATLAGRVLRIDDIRSLDSNPGLRDYEASFLRLMEKISNGVVIQINETGTSLRYKPGVLLGGSGIIHDCPTSRSVGYFLESLVALAPFAKKPMAVTLRGVTNADLDTSVDVFRTVTIPLLKHFGVDDVALKIVKRGAPPAGGGEVHFTCPIVRELKSIDITDEGRIKRIRGICYTAHGSAANGSRVVTAARSVFNALLPDVYIYTDHYSKKNAGPSPGCAVSLVAQSTTGCLLSAQATSIGTPDFEALGLAAANLLCEEAARGGCVDTSHQALALLLMLLTPEDVSRLRTGPLSPHTIQCMRHYRDIFGVTFKLRADRAQSDLEADLAREQQAAADAKHVDDEDDDDDDDEDDDEEDGDHDHDHGDADGGDSKKQQKKGAKKPRSAADAADQAAMDEADSGDTGKGTRKSSKKARRRAERDARKAKEQAKRQVDVSAVEGRSAYTVVLSCLGIGYKNFARKTA